MRILIPVLGYDRAGGYRVLSRLASQWRAAGATVRFLAPSGAGAPYFPTDAELLETDLQGHVAPGGGLAREPARLEGARRIACLAAGLRTLSGTHDVVLANHSLTAWPVALFATGGNRRFYYVQAYEPEYFWMEREPVKWLLARLSYRLPLCQISNSPTYAEQGPVRPIAIVPPGLDLSLFAPRPNPRDFADGAPVVLGCIGRREPAKGIRYVLEAFGMLHAADPRFRLRVAYGNLPDGFSHPEMEIVVPADDAALACYYRSIDILIAPGTVQHGAPHYPVMEAMACATPVVTTGYMPADPSNSWIVENRSAAAIADAVRSIVAEPGYAARVAAAQGAIQRFAWDKVAARMLEVFRSNG
jgi:glycosyltransferase involved in cell wall biosynthesis